MSYMEFTWRDKIIALRIQKGLSKEELAASIGMARGTLDSIETGKQSPRIAQLKLIAVALGADVEVILRGLEQDDA